MSNKTSYLVVDAGNTRIKIALFSNEDLLVLQIFSSEDIKSFVNYLVNLNYNFSILSSVLSDENTKFILSHLSNPILFNSAKIPIKTSYSTPQTLGADRLSNAVALTFKYKGNRLAIDIGTCIKFDFVDENNIYLGGSISPGMNMRFKALNNFTGKLPLLDFVSETKLIGDSTKTCIETGVIMGVQEEINGFITKYEKLYPNLTVIVTGGDHINFDYSIKKDIFADPNLTIWGLYQILKTNV